LHVRGRLAYGRVPSLGTILAVLVLTLGAPITALAAGGTTPATPEQVTPRTQEPGEATGYGLPFEPELAVPIHQGWNSRYSHNGRAAFAYDFGLHEGTPVLASAGGIVTHAVDGFTACGGADLLHMSNYVTINHPDGSATHYGHMASVDVEVGQPVAAGEQIGLSGKTGFSGCRPHLHFARQAQGGPVTQSVPVYFHGFADRSLVNGDTVEASAPACAPDDAEAPLEAFCGTYSGLGEDQPAMFSRLDPAIDFKWSKEPPGGYWLDEPTEGFAAAWAGRFEFAAAGIYSIRGLASDRVRIRIDGQTVFDSSSDRPTPRNLTALWNLSPGVHLVEVEHQSVSGRGVLELDWEFVRVPEGDERWSRSGPLT
jgi:murein DD-endopeptidase MepM/ murein hydrolase activator NlpD